jgi:hypothetical protein
MKMFKKLLFAGLAFATLNVSAQTADEIVAKNIEAMGGAAKLASLTSVKMTGTMSAQGQDFPVTFTTLHQKGVKIEFEIMGTSNYYMANAEKGFIFMPIAQMQEPKEMEPEQYSSFAKQMDLQGQFMNYKEKGTKIELAGTEKIDGAEADKLKVTTKEGKTSTYFIDKKTSRLVKTIGTGKGQDGTDTEMETTFSDYKQNDGGYWFAYSSSTPNGPLTFDKIETNVKVDESIFKP